MMRYLYIFIVAFPSVILAGTFPCTSRAQSSEDILVQQCVNSVSSTSCVGGLPAPTSSVTTVYVGSYNYTIPATQSTPQNVPAEISGVHIYPYNTGAFVLWFTTTSSTTTLSWGSSDGVSQGEYSEKIPSTIHVVRIEGLIPNTLYALEVNVPTASSTSFHPAVFTTTNDNEIPSDTVTNRPTATQPHTQEGIVKYIGTIIGSTTPGIPTIHTMSADKETYSSIVNMPEVITYRFIPKSWIIPVHSTFVVHAIRSSTQSHSDTLLNHDPDPMDESIKVDLTGTLIYGLFAFVLTLLLVRRLFTFL